MKKSVLLVDDNKSVVEIIRALLLRNDFDVEMALSAQQAWEQLNKKKVDLIISDVMMPGEDGFQFAKKLKADEGFRDIPIIYLTALDSLEDEFEGFMSGGIDYVTKPFKARDLLDKIKNVLEKREDGVPLVMRRGMEIEVARVLVLANNRQRRDQILQVIDAQGYECEGEDAKPTSFARLDQERFHLLIAQVGEGGISDEDVTRFLKSFRLGLPLILIHEKGVEIHPEARARAYAVLALPVVADELADQCRMALAQYSEH